MVLAFALFEYLMKFMLKCFVDSNSCDAIGNIVLPHKSDKKKDLFLKNKDSIQTAQKMCANYSSDLKFLIKYLINTITVT